MRGILGQGRVIRREGEREEKREEGREGNRKRGRTKNEGGREGGNLIQQTVRKRMRPGDGCDPE